MYMGARPHTAKFILYTGNESAEEKNIRSIFIMANGTLKAFLRALQMNYAKNMKTIILEKSLKLL